MSALDQAVQELALQARVAAACGAVGVTGVPLGTALHAIGDRRIGPVRFASDARLDRLAVIVRTAVDVAEDVFDALAVPGDAVWQLTDAVSPSEVELRVEVTAEGEVTVGAMVEMVRSAAEAVDLLRWVSPAARDGLGDGIMALELPRVTAMGICGDRVSLTLAQTLSALDVQGERLAVASRLVASSAQASWQRAMLSALGPGRARAPVTLAATDAGLVEVGVAYDDVAAETVLRTMLALAPQERSGAVLGALAAVAGEGFRLELVAHAEEPPGVRFVLGGP
jgi:hypothetical protein